MKKSPFVPVVIPGGASLAPQSDRGRGENGVRQATESAQMRYHALGLPESKPTAARPKIVLKEVAGMAQPVQLSQKTLADSLQLYRSTKSNAAWEKFVASLKHVAKNDANRLIADSMESADGLERWSMELTNILRSAGHFKILPGLNDFMKTRLVYSQVLAIQDGLQDVEHVKSVIRDGLYRTENLHERFGIDEDEYERLDLGLKSLIVQGMRIYTKEFWTAYEQGAPKHVSKIA